jgi:hypothetical protein
MPERNIAGRTRTFLGSLEWRWCRRGPKLATELASGLLVISFLGSVIGCGEGSVTEQFNQGVEQAKETVSKGVEQTKEAAQKVTDAAKQATTTVKETAGLSGKISLTSNPPVSTTGAYATFVAPIGEQNGTLQIQSYAPAQAETFPSVFVRALVTAKSLNELVGQSTGCEVFVQTQAEGPVWRIAAGDSAQLKIIGVEGKLLKAEIVSATLHETSAEEAISFTGLIEAVLP